MQNNVRVRVRCQRDGIWVGDFWCYLCRRWVAELCWQDDGSYGRGLWPDGQIDLSSYKPLEEIANG